VHAHRPAQCATYPWWPGLVDGAAWRREAEDVCEGMGDGTRAARAEAARGAAGAVDVPSAAGQLIDQTRRVDRRDHALADARADALADGVADGADDTGAARLPTSDVVVVLCGPAGSGKSSVAPPLAARLGGDGDAATVVEGDDHHAPESLASMARGEPLTEADRAPWLERVGSAAAGAAAASPPGRGNVVVACSALKWTHRKALVEAVARGARPPPSVVFVHLACPEAELAARLTARAASGGAHPVGPALLPSQLATLEPPGDDAARPGGSPWTSLVVDAGGARSSEDVAAEIAERLRPGGT